MEHTKGKLSLNNYHYPHAFLVIRKGSEDNDAFPRPRKICDVTLEGKTEEEYEANAKHLVRCWNSHDNLLAACEQGRDEIRGQLEATSGLLENSTSKTYWYQLIDVFEQAIAKAKL